MPFFDISNIFDVNFRYDDETKLSLFERRTLTCNEVKMEVNTSTLDNDICNDCKYMPETLRETKCSIEKIPCKGRNGGSCETIWAQIKVKKFFSSGITTDRLIDFRVKCVCMCN